MYIESQDVKDWLKSLDPDAVVYNGTSVTECVVTTYAKTLNTDVWGTAPDLLPTGEHQKGHVYDNHNEEVGSTSGRVANYMDLFDRNRGEDNVLTAGQALEILEREGI